MFAVFSWYGGGGAVVVLPDSPETADGGLIGSFVEDENGDLVYPSGAAGGSTPPTPTCR